MTEILKLLNSCPVFLDHHKMKELILGNILLQKGNLTEKYLVRHAVCGMRREACSVRVFKVSGFAHRSFL